MSLDPVFLFGYERSGTTLLSMMVGAHPKIAVPLSTTGLWYRYANRLEQYNGLLDQCSVKKMIHDLLLEQRIQMWDEELTSVELMPHIESGNYASVVAAFYSLYAAKKNKPYWAMIDISTLHSMDKANNWFPTARFLHIVRDGRDVALSHETYKYGLATTTEVASHWEHDLKTNIKMGGMINPGRYKVIRYEELVIEPEKTLQNVCQFVGVEYSDEMLSYPQMVEQKVPQDRRFLWPVLNQPPKKSNAYRWKTQMSLAKRIVFEWNARDMLDLLGYEVFEVVPKSLGAYLFDFWCYIGKGGRVKRLKEKLKLGRNG